MSTDPAVAASVATARPCSISPLSSRISTRPLHERLGERLLRGALSLMGLEFRIVRTEPERSQARALRARIFASAGYSADLSEVARRYDDHATMVVGSYRGQLVGTLTLVDAAVSCRVLELWNLRLPTSLELPRTQEISALAVDPAHRGRGRAVVIGMLDVAFQEARRRGVDWWLASSSEANYRAFRSINPHCQLLEELPPTALHLAHRERYRSYFADRGQRAQLFAFELGQVSYTANLGRMLAGRARRLIRGRRRRLGTAPRG